MHAPAMPVESGHSAEDGGLRVQPAGGTMGAPG